ncbi:MAG: type II secretion system protein GspL, partial [Gammaproteobacteria bacterium]|nr:type II secretion system protein GspL [Gammaproteobacteria bacterium]
MTDRIFIYMPSDQSEVDWLVASGQNTARSGQDALTNIAPLCRNHQVVLVVPGNSTTLRTTALPVTNKKQLLKAIPYALEEQLIEDVDNLHFAVGKQGVDKSTPVAVTRQQNMKNWLSILKKHNITPEIIIPDTLLLPLKRKEWSAVIHNDSMNVRTGQHNGFSCDNNNAAFMLKTAIEESTTNKPERINLFLAEGATTPDGLNDLDIEVISHSLGDNPLAILSGNINGSAVINLMQGTF